MTTELRRERASISVCYFIDWSQNADHKTTVSVYSLRAKRERPFVSMPVRWEELDKALRLKDADSLYFEAPAALARVRKVGDLFKPVLKLKQRLPARSSITR